MDEAVRPLVTPAAGPQAGRGVEALVRAHDWSATPLGPAATWPQSLRTIVALVLASDFPMVALWGPDLIQIYNDGYAAIMGPRHPTGLGQSTRACWPEVWHINAPIYERVRAGETVTFEDALYPITRDSHVQDAWFTLSYSPLRDETGDVAGILVTVVETTARLRAEGERRQSERRLRAVLEQGPLAIALTGPAGEIAFHNAEFDRLWGRPAHETTAGTYSRDYKGFHLDGRPVASEEWPAARAVLEGRTIDGEVLEIVHQSGRRIACSFNAGPVRDEDGRIVGAVVMFRDVTEEHRMQVALARQTEERFRAIVETARDYAIFTTDVEDRIETWPPGAQAVFGWTAAEVVGQPYDVLFTPEDRAAGVPEAEVATAREQGQAPNVRWHLRKDGSRVFIEGIVRPLTDPEGRVSGYVKVGQDITERRATEERLRELNETLEQRVAEALAERQVLADFVESTEVSILAFDMEHRILAINEANAAEIERVYGRRPQVGDDLLAMLADRPEHQAQVARNWDRVLAGEEFMIVEEFGDTAHERVTYEVRFNVLRDREGRQVGAYQTAFDVTPRVRAQAELELAQEALRQAQKMEAMGQLTGGVAHDFNNLLTPIIGALDRLLSQGLGGEREQRLMVGALASAERAKTLVQRLLAFARRQPLQAVAVDVAALVEEMAGLIGSTLGPKVELRVDLAPDLPPAHADANQLEMALLNLAVNAQDAMPDGGILTVSASRASARGPRPPGLRRGPYLLLAVADTGVGMDEETVARAVEPFFSTKGVGRGTGLGLSMVHGLAAQLGGGLTIRSERGRGTSVELWLPVSAERAEPARDKTPVPSPGRMRGQVLLVDDEELVRQSTADMLADLGFEVLEAGSGEEALQILHRAEAVDLLVTDHLMPGMSGVDLARAARLRRPDMPVLIVSGYADVEGLAPDLVRLVKPFRAAELADSVAAAMPDQSNT